MLHIGSTPTYSYFDLYLYPAYAAHYVRFYNVWEHGGNVFHFFYKITRKKHVAFFIKA